MLNTILIHRKYTNVYIFLSFLFFIRLCIILYKLLFYRFLGFESNFAFSKVFLYGQCLYPASHFFTIFWAQYFFMIKVLDLPGNFNFQLHHHKKCQSMMWTTKSSPEKWPILYVYLSIYLSSSQDQREFFFVLDWVKSYLKKNHLHIWLPI